VNRSREEFLPRAGLTGDEDGGIAARDSRHSRQHGRQRRRGADNLFEHRRLVDFLSQRHVFLLQPLLGPPAIVDIGTREIPPNQLPLVVAEWIVSNQKPAICSVALSEPQVPLWGA
jgi:hypothetical protein